MGTAAQLSKIRCTVCISRIDKGKRRKTGLQTQKEKKKGLGCPANRHVADRVGVKMFPYWRAIDRKDKTEKSYLSVFFFYVAHLGKATFVKHLIFRGWYLELGFSTSYSG